MARFCLSIKDCRSQASFNDSTIKGLGPKMLAWEPKFYTAMRKSVLIFGSKVPIDSDEWLLSYASFRDIHEGARERHHRYDNQLLSNIFCIMSRSSRL